VLSLESECGRPRSIIVAAEELLTRATEPTIVGRLHFVLGEAYATIVGHSQNTTGNPFEIFPPEDYAAEAHGIAFIEWASV